MLVTGRLGIAAGVFVIVSQVGVAAPDSGAPRAARSGTQPAAAVSPPPRHVAAKGGDEHFLKGYEIYSWRDRRGRWRYALLPGTNRLKSQDEIFASPMTEAELSSHLAKLQELEDVSWCPPAQLRTHPRLEIPPKSVTKPLVESAKKHNIHVQFCTAVLDQKAPGGR